VKVGVGEGEVRVSGSGLFLYVMGREVIAIFNIHQSQGTLYLVGQQELEASPCRHFHLSPDCSLLLSLDFQQQCLQAFHVNLMTGVVDDSACAYSHLPSPICLC